MTKIICENCKKECEKPTKEINRQIKQGRTKFYCSISCSTTNLLTKTEIIKSNCLFCGKEIKTTTHKKHKKCCNQICSTKYAQQFVDPDNHRLSVQREKTFPRNKNFECVVCSKIFSKKRLILKLEIEMFAGTSCFIFFLLLKNFLVGNLLKNMVIHFTQMVCFRV